MKTTYRASGRTITILVGSFCLVLMLSVIALAILDGASLRAVTLTPTPWITAVLGTFIQWLRLREGSN
ncbi:Hypothetical protein ACGLYG10_1103 [Actinomyces glycerinitolerans]|uniref:Uncharacterized protein n=1 Tax=Actinomyces glycerinitolerans TaxID=1892869 RepID=A0A1M4RY41_9ACTO|nr:Hypothetical protein ACGLYG10_1103 [Actinomyces glycerinitolerans]